MTWDSGEIAENVDIYIGQSSDGCFVAVTLLLAPLTRSPRHKRSLKICFGAMGLIAEDKEPIGYRERTPLVLPPRRMGLREPARPETAQGRSGHWPQDPDVAARKRRKADVRVPVTDESQRALDETYRSSAIVEERVGRSAGAKVPDGPVVRESDSARLNLPWRRSEQTKRPSLHDDIVSRRCPRALTEAGPSTGAGAPSATFVVLRPTRRSRSVPVNLFSQDVSQRRCVLRFHHKPSGVREPSS